MHLGDACLSFQNLGFSLLVKVAFVVSGLGCFVLFCVWDRSHCVSQAGPELPDSPIPVSQGAANTGCAHTTPNSSELDFLKKSGLQFQFLSLSITMCKAPTGSLK